jgi:ribulose-5-phosphate 4-epimerase/fuculose-1-phosphate aldolase
VVTVGTGLDDAYFRMETVEHFAQILHHAMQLGSVGRLGEPEMQRLKNLRHNLRRVKT